MPSPRLASSSALRGRLPAGRGALLAALLASLAAALACGDDRDPGADPDPDAGDDDDLVCPSPDDAFTWPVDREPVAITPSDAWKPSIALDDPFLSAAYGADGFPAPVSLA